MPQAIHANAEFVVTRHDNYIFIRLRLPVSVIPDVYVYRTEIVDLPVPVKQGLRTSLTNIPQYFVYSEMSAFVGELIKAPSHSIIRASDVVWSRHYADECLQDIFRISPSLFTRPANTRCVGLE